MSATSLGTLVTYNPWAIGPTALLADVAARFEELAVHHVPVVDADRRVIGMLSESDLLRCRQATRAVLAGGGPDTDDAPAVFARDAMTRQVISIGVAKRSADALRILLDNRIHALPVVENGRLIGLVTSLDFLREFSYGELPGSREPISSLLPASPPEPLDPDAELDEALLAMHEAGVGCLAVAKAGCPLGILAQRDIVREKCRLIENDGDLQTCTQPATILSAVRASPSIRPGQRLCEAAAAMVELRLPAVIIVNQSNRLLGLITEDDILRVMYDAEA
jgi:CBS domain-containing protein